MLDSSASTCTYSVVNPILKVSELIVWLKDSVGSNSLLDIASMSIKFKPNISGFLLINVKRSFSSFVSFVLKKSVLIKLTSSKDSTPG